MVAIRVWLPDLIHQQIKELSAREGISVNQFVASAALKQLALMMTKDYLRYEASKARRSDFYK